MQSPLTPAAVTTGFAAIPAGKAFAFSVHRNMSRVGGVYTFCIPTSRFIPEPGRYYRATYVRSDNECGIVLESSASAALADLRAESFQKMSFSNAMDENGSFCSLQK